MDAGLPHLHQRFLHSQVDETSVEESYRDPYRITGGLKFTDGEKVSCPNCKVESRYEKYRLIFAQQMWSKSRTQNLGVDFSYRLAAPSARI
jgi:hypothetical protein